MDYIDVLPISQALPTYEKDTFSGKEAIECCSRNICIHSFGSLRSKDGAPAIAILKVYLSTAVYSADDMSVSDMFKRITKNS